MRIFRKVKLGVRLTLSYILAIVLILLLSLVAITSVNRLSHESREMFVTDVDPLSILNDISADSFYMIEAINNSVLFSTDRDLMQDYISLYESYKNKIVLDMAAYEEILLKNNIDTEQFLVMQDMYLNEFVEMLDAAMAYAMDKVQPDDVGLFMKLNVMPTANAFTEMVQQLYNTHAARAEIISAQQIHLSNRITYLILLIFPLALIITSLWMYLLTKSVTVPVRQLVTATNEIARGNLDVNLPESSEDELGMLTSAFLQMKQTLNQLTDDMDNMANGQSEGDIHAFIHDGKFSGKFQDIAIKINEMTKARLEVTTQIMNCISKMGEGDFDAPLDRFSGDLSQINFTIDGLRSDLKNVHEKISTLVLQAVKGDLSARSDTTELKGDWKKLGDEINTLLDKITLPIYEAQEVLEAFSQGNLSVRMSNSYKGDYENIKSAINGSIETIHSYVSEISYILEEMAEQQLNVNIERDYIGDFLPVKNAINHIIYTFNSILGNINETSLKVGTQAKSFSQSSKELAAGAKDQAVSVKKLTVSLEQVTQKAEDASAVAANAKDIIEGAAANAGKGSIEMEEMLQVVTEINNSSNTISKIVQIIEDIAFQTNLLSLNASVEAARAGEHGKGFAVVAGEVRALAKSSQDAAKDISEIIENSMSLYQSGTNVAKQTSLSLKKMLDDISVLAGLMGNISQATEEQRANIIAINNNLVQISGVTEQVSNKSMEEAEMSAEMFEQAHFLIQQVSKFNLVQ